MDPVTALGVAAAAGQFLGTAVKVGVRLKKYGGRTRELPVELETISRRLGMLQSCLTDIKTRLERQSPQDPLLEGESLRTVNDFIASLNRRCAQLEALLAKYLPSDGDGLADRLIKGLKSLSKDKEIGAIAQGLLDDATLLTLRQITPNGSSGNGSSGSASSNGQPAAGEVLANIPDDRRVSNAIAREEILHSIDRAYASSGSRDPRVVILQGMGGQGKTQLALEFCRKAKHAKKYAGIFWVDAASSLTALKSFGAIATKIHPDGIFQDDKARMRYAKDRLESWSVPWLVVFDNYDDPTSFPIKKYFPTSSHGNVLMTTRSPSTSALGTMLEIPGMNESQALQLLFSQSGLTWGSETEIHGRAIVERLGYLPLAIAQIASYLGERKDTLRLSDFLELYEREMPKLLGKTPDIWEYLNHAEEGTQRERIKSVITTWNFSLGLLQDTTEHPEQKAYILSLLGFFAISDISESLFKAYFESFDDESDRPTWLRILGRGNVWVTDLFEDVILELRRFSLISTSSRSNEDDMMRVSLHPLVRDWIILRLQYHRPMGAFPSTGFRMEQANRKDYLSHLGVWEQNRQKPVARHQVPMLIHVTDEYTISTVEGLFAEFYQDCDMYQQSQPLLEWLWEQCDLPAAPWPAQRFLAGYWLSAIYYFLQDETTGPDSVVAVARRNLEFCRKFLGDTPLVITAEHGFAWALKNADDGSGSSRKEATQILDSMLQYLDLPIVMRHPIISKLVGALIESDEPDDLEKAYMLVQRCYEESKTEDAESYRRENWSTYEWSTVVDYLQDGDARLVLAREFVTAMTRLVGTNHRFYIYTRRSLADSLACNERFQDAADVYEACISALEQSGIKENVLEDCLAGLGGCYQKLGRSRDAIPLLNRSILSWQQGAAPTRRRYRRMDDSAEMLAEAYETLGDHENMLSAASFRLVCIENMVGCNNYVASTIISAHVQVFHTKANLVDSDSRPRFAADQVVCHLDTALSVVVAESRRQKGYGTERPIGDNSETGTVSGGELSAEQLAAKVNDWHGFDLVVRKAWYFSGHQLYEEAIKAFYMAKMAFDACPSLTADDVWWFLRHTWVILDMVADSGTLQDFETSSLISWTCSVARSHLGDVGATRDEVQKRIGDRIKLLNYLPLDEPYVNGLRPAPPPPSPPVSKTRYRLRKLFLFRSR